MKLILIFVFLFSLQAQAVETIINVTGVAISQTSTAALVPGLSYSAQCDISGAAFDIDVKLQASLDGSLWTDIDGLSANFTSPDDLLMDVTGGSHLQARVVVTRNSGTYNIICKLKN